MLDFYNVWLAILATVLVCLVLSVICLLMVMLMLLKVAVQEFLREFGLKKTAVVATMALVLLSGATAMAGETIVQIEDGNLVYYEKTKVKVVPNIPKGITAEQARQLVDGKTPVVSFSKEETRVYLGIPLTKMTETAVSFRGGWITKEVSNKSLPVLSMFVIAVPILWAFITAYIGDSKAIFFMVAVLTALAVPAVFPWDIAFIQAVGAFWTLSFIGYFFGLSLRYLRRRREKKQNAGHGLTAEPT